MSTNLLPGLEINLSQPQRHSLVSSSHPHIFHQPHPPPSIHVPETNLPFAASVPSPIISRHREAIPAS